ncbi:uncharacterized protein [Enoplosus armatus]|uniref:uncharacterized protein n=1 Tax=Enoplosus armatus TaxID=215367 RepID=UPI00399466B6
MSLFVILVLLFTAAVTQQKPPAFTVTVRVGDEVTLPCENVIKCDRASWTVSRHTGATSRELVNLGQIIQDKSNRLNVTENCSLVIKNVTVEDVGRYSCRQFRKSGRQKGSDANVVLSVINVDPYLGNDTVTFFCTVLSYDKCEHTVEWLYESNKEVLEPQQFTCAATVTLTTHPLNQDSNCTESLKCKVTEDKSRQTLLSNVDLQSSCEKTESKGITTEGRNKTSPADEETTTKQDWWRFIYVFVGLAVLLISVVVVNIWKKTKGNKTPIYENIGLSLNPAVTQPGPESRQDMVRTTSSGKVMHVSSEGYQVGGEDDDEGDAVTYSTSSAGASADPSDLYATVNKPHCATDVY